MKLPRSLAVALAGLAATLVTVLALATPAAAGTPPFVVKVAKDKDGPYKQGFTDVNLQGGQVKDFFFRVRNKEPEPFNNMRFQEIFGPAPDGMVYRWFKGNTNITQEVQTSGYAFNLPGDGRRFFRFKAKATADGLTDCMGGEADFQNTIADAAFLQFNTGCA